LQDHQIAELTVLSQNTFDAVEVFSSFDELKATTYMYEHYVDKTTTLAKLIPGLDVHGDHKVDPPCNQDPQLETLDYVVQEKMFVVFMAHQCVAGTAQNDLMK
jgi:hypothetical protein